MSLLRKFRPSQSFGFCPCTSVPMLPAVVSYDRSCPIFVARPLKSTGPLRADDAAEVVRDRSVLAFAALGRTASSANNETTIGISGLANVNPPGVAVLPLRTKQGLRNLT